MPLQVLVIHGAGEPRRRGNEVYWKPMLEASLGPGYVVTAPRMPDPEEPGHSAWSKRIAELMSGMERPFVVGHSFGASTLLKFLAQSDRRPAFRGLFLVATPYWGDDLPEFALTSEQLHQLRSLSPLFFYQSKDDTEVEISHFKKYQEALPQAVFRLLDHRGHEFDLARFPELADDIRSLAKGHSFAVF